ncbi:Prolyl-tRNA editing protein ProX [bioreactor metagenome]|jgi:Uncharacterized conserved protein|uniref:Prolyl-tRNA editing protein ProX n=1 Tax=bioreactor metagenome TaxID=1076179 RepID=A0A644UQL7_9ZZZZ|nr:prolyl-tRNA synthetase associated domain-containing protein [Desulfovibrio desulfuricans]MEA4989971.1 prolyl-tRNA synthetase associated domain-containing protein [Desulfovibrio desulfuricans]
MSDLEKRQKVYDYLKRLEVKYTVTEHPAVFSIDEIKALKINLKGDVCKNLFLRDSAGKRHFLVTMRNDKTAPLKVLQQKLGISRLSFASQERLAKYLDLAQGEVTPFGILNDEGCEVEIVFDSALEGNPCLGVHPNDNTATVWISFNDLYRSVSAHGNRIHMVALDD